MTELHTCLTRGTRHYVVAHDITPTQANLASKRWALSTPSRRELIKKKQRSGWTRRLTTTKGWPSMVIKQYYKQCTCMSIRLRYYKNSSQYYYIYSPWHSATYLYTSITQANIQYTYKCPDTTLSQCKYNHNTQMKYNTRLNIKYNICPIQRETLAYRDTRRTPRNFAK